MPTSRHSHSPKWWPEGESWPPRPGGRGHQEWQRFGKRMFVAFIFFVAFMVAVASVIGWLIVTAVSGVASGNRIVIGVVTFIGAVIILRGFSRRTFRPVRDLIGAAGRLADGDYSARVRERPPSSMRAVSKSFNQMAERLEESDTQRRRLMSDLGHELRTPLQVIRGEIEAVIDGVHEGGPEHMASLLDEVEVMERLIEDLRVLTLSEAGKLPLQLERADVIEVIDEVVSSYRATAASSSVEISSRTPQGALEVEMDPVRIRQALSNLVVNSIRAMPGGGSVAVEVEDHGDRVVIGVVDTGTGIDPDQLDEVFERFVKSEESPGSGLGLSIARGLVRAHGGDLEIAESGPDGTTAAFWLPR